MTAARPGVVPALAGAGHPHTIPIVVHGGRHRPPYADPHAVTTMLPIVTWPFPMPGGTVQGRTVYLPIILGVGVALVVPALVTLVAFLAGVTP